MVEAIILLSTLLCLVSLALIVVLKEAQRQRDTIRRLESETHRLTHETLVDDEFEDAEIEHRLETLEGLVEEVRDTLKAHVEVSARRAEEEKEFFEDAPILYRLIGRRRLRKLLKKP